MNTVFWENIERIMSKNGISQVRLGKDSHVSRQTINKVVQTSPYKQHNTKLSTALSITEALDVDFPSLFSRLNIEEVDLNGYVQEEYLEVFRQNVNRHLRERGKTQKSLSTEPGIGEATISEVLNGTVSDPYLSSLLYISEMLDVNIEKLFRRSAINNDI